MRLYLDRKWNNTTRIKWFAIGIPVVNGGEGVLVGGGLVVGTFVTSIIFEYRTEVPIIPSSPMIGNTIT